MGMNRGNKRKQAQEILLRCLREGVSLPVALRVAGVPKATYYDWLKRYPAFAQAVECAEAEALSAIERVLYITALQGDTKSAMWLLSRRCPETYSLKHQPADEDYTVELYVPPDDGSVPYKIQLASQPTNGTKS